MQFIITWAKKYFCVWLIHCSLLLLFFFRYFLPILCNDNFDEQQKVAKGLFGSCNRTKTPRLKSFSRVDKFRNFFYLRKPGNKRKVFDKSGESGTDPYQRKFNYVQPRLSLNRMAKSTVILFVFSQSRYTCFLSKDPRLVTVKRG